MNIMQYFGKFSPCTRCTSCGTVALYGPIFFFKIWSAIRDRPFNLSGADPGFQVRGAPLKKLFRAEGCVKIFGVFRVKNHDFTPKNHIFSNFRGGGDASPLDPPLVMVLCFVQNFFF